MKLTAKHLRHIIQEELTHTLLEPTDVEKYRVELTNYPGRWLTGRTATCSRLRLIS